ncbi:hypothetical protein ACFPRL_06945 [Pseudoclavibacter helvolus]
MMTAHSTKTTPPRRRRMRGISGTRRAARPRASVVTRRLSRVRCSAVRLLDGHVHE